jgi:hypothetical protein
MEKIAEFSYERLWVIGAVFGTLKNAYEIREILVKNPKIELAHVIQEPARKFLAGYSFEPVADITLSCLPRELSVVCSGFDRKGMVDLIKEVKEKTGLTERALNPGFFKGLEMEVKLIHSQNYEYAKLISDKSKYDMGRVVNSLYYSNFLNRYMGFNQENSFRKSGERFGIKLIG